MVGGLGAAAFGWIDDWIGPKRATAFLGPALVGTTTALFGTQRAGMAVVFVFLLAGIVILRPLPAPEQLLQERAQ